MSARSRPVPPNSTAICTETSDDWGRYPPGQSGSSQTAKIGSSAKVTADTTRNRRSLTIHGCPVVGTACRCGLAVPTTISTASTGVVVLVPVVQGRATVSLCHGDASFLYVLTAPAAALLHICSVVKPRGLIRV